MLRSMSSPPPRPRASGRWAFFLDIDGTLIEHVEKPDAVHADPALVRLLASLRAAAGGAVALISGRPIGFVDALFEPLRLPVAGLHGIERRDALGRLHSHPTAEKPLRHAAGELAERASRHAGLIVEDKGLSLALHYRQAPQLETAAREIATAVLDGLGEEFELMRGSMVFEIKPGGRDKGAAIGEFLAEAPFEGLVPAFVGDDVTDEFGFARANFD
jgi:trehalose 6-phosphate phosphatase